MEVRDISSFRDLFLHGKFDDIYELLNDESLNSQTFTDDSFSRKLFLINIMIVRRSIFRGLAMISEFKDENTYDQLQSYILDCLHARLLLQQGSNQPALKIIDNLASNPSKIENDKYPIMGNLEIYVGLLKSKYYNSLGEIDLAVNYANQCYFLNKEVNDLYNLPILYEELAKLHLERGDIVKAQEICQELFQIGEEQDNKYYKFLALINETNVVTEAIELEKAKELIQQAKEIANELNSNIHYYYVKHYEAFITRYQGNLDVTRKHHLENLKIVEKFQGDLMRGAILNNLGIIENRAGNLDLALDYIFKSLEIYEKLDIQSNIGTAYNNLAINYMMKGELDLSLQYLNKSREIAEQHGTQKDRATAYVNLGQMYHMKGEFDSAEKYYLQCYEIDLQHENDLNVSEVLYNLIVLNVEIKRFEKAEKYFRLLQEIDLKTQNKMILLRCKLGQVQIFKSSKRSIKQAKAQEILKEIVNEDPIDYELYVDSLLNLCEILLIELKQTGEEEVLEEIKEYVQILIDYATTQDSYSLLAEGFLIKSKLAELELDMATAKEMIEKAEEVSLNKGLDKMAMKISRYYDQLLDKMKSVDNLTHKHISMKDRLEDVQLEEIILQMIDTKAENLQSEHEKPTMFMIIQEGGNSIYSKKFVTDNTVNEELVAGLFSALHSLSDQVFNTNSGTQRIRHEEYTVVMKSLENKLLFSYVFRGSSFNAMKKLDRLVNSIENSSTIWNALNRKVSHLTSHEKEGMDIIVDSILGITELSR